MPMAGCASPHVRLRGAHGSPEGSQTTGNRRDRPHGEGSGAQRGVARSAINEAGDYVSSRPIGVPSDPGTVPPRWGRR